MNIVKINYEQLSKYDSVSFLFLFLLMQNGPNQILFSRIFFKFFFFFCIFLFPGRKIPDCTCNLPKKLQYD